MSELNNKKRNATTEISKDNPEGSIHSDEEAPQQKNKTASAEVLQNRKIVRGKRSVSKNDISEKSSNETPKFNPFATIKLVETNFNQKKDEDKASDEEKEEKEEKKEKKEKEQKKENGETKEEKSTTTPNFTFGFNSSTPSSSTPGNDTTDTNKSTTTSTYTFGFNTTSSTSPSSSTSSTYTFGFNPSSSTSSSSTYTFGFNPSSSTSSSSTSSTTTFGFGVTDQTKDNSNTSSNSVTSNENDKGWECPCCTHFNPPKSQLCAECWISRPKPKK
eukprot:TRINITY_DN584_c0_g3_i2.p2 TRINITY_DN584_c0_g3~~TRINITY_DN584_c0_g3_i2.p2  ORF type:complete len:274 (+),score=151.91 TRINITY_DN584_c0_g3_i2:105-926(+)